MRKLRPKQHVTLEAGELGRLGARIEEVGDDHVTLALFVSPDRRLDIVEVLDATLVLTDSRGVFRITGAVQPTPRPDTLHFELRGEAEVVQRREFARADAVRPIRVSRTTDGEDAIDTFMLNVSGGGLLIAGPDTLQPGETVWLDIKLGEPGNVVKAEATVVRTTDEGHRGVRIERIAPKDRELIVRFVFDSQRRARSVVRDA